MKKVIWALAVMLVLLAGGCARQETNLLTWQLEEGRWVAQQEMERYTLEADIPSVNETIDQANKARAEQLARAFALAMAERLEELPEITGNGAWVLDGSVSCLEPILTSVALTQYDYLPGNAHGAYMIETTTYDNETCKPIALTDLFKPEVDVYRELSRITYWMLMDSDQLGDYADPQWISAGTEPVASNFSAFMVRPEGLEIIFAPYQIGPWVLGEQRLTIPWARLAPLLAPSVAQAAGVSG